MTATVKMCNRIEPLAREWEHLAQRTEAPPFLRPGWVSAWWRAFGTGQLNVLTAYENNQLVGLIPLRQLRGRSFDLVPNTDVPRTGCLAANETAAEQLWDTLFSQEPRRVDLTYVSPADTGVTSALTSARAAGYRVLEKSRPLDEQVPYVAIDGPWDTYESGLRRKFRSELRRRRRRLEEEGRLSLEVSTGKQE